MNIFIVALIGLVIGVLLGLYLAWEYGGGQ